MPRIVFVPAFACDEALYAPLAAALGPDFPSRTVVPAKRTMRECAEDVLEQAGDGSFIVCGTSFGGHVARELAFLAPDKVAGLVVMGAGAAAPADPAPTDKRRAAIEAGRQAEMLADMAESIVFEPEGRGRDAAETFRAIVARATPELLLAQNEALATRPGRESGLSTIRMPSLMLWGEHDRFSPPSAGIAMAQAMPDAEFVLLPDCGHLPSLEKTDAVAATIRRRFGA
ncbi:alpha/beta fold hydrolase [Aureimonas psammosilenae]|uniref:alpha/beta fold hydrolase n=1 Tax=Aureimonas psammosilenae TaxID=2495496 RepID=UPI001869A8F7|nr:alpha/beta hydrolase [Aureimonas psammosilenae]